MYSYNLLPDYIRTYPIAGAVEYQYEPVAYEHMISHHIPDTQASAVEAWERCFEEIDELAQLQLNWDGYGGHALGAGAVQAAIRACVAFSRANLPVPEISPKSGGTIGLSWELAEGEAYIEIGNTTFSGYLTVENFETALFSGAADEIVPELLFPLLQAEPASQLAGYTIADIKINPELVYGFAA
ncbi:hypothetical protein PQR29_04600 [Paraburkholderia strydomiana]|uniref:hypothetical protein n=1 Tax=Paraburkholderia strydomiana TaxID=1245417 RepID=UPI0038B90B2F